MKHWYTIKAQAGEQPAEITIFDSIGATWDGEGVTAKAFISDLKSLNAEKITLLINSPGGSVFDGLAIYNALLATKAEITGKVLGVAASAASFILMACKRIVMPENSFLMIHNASTLTWGGASDMRETADWLDKIGDSLVNIYATRTGKSPDEIRAFLDAETWFSAAEAKDLGFADEVESAFHATAAFDLTKLPDHIRASFATSPAAAIPALPNLTERIKALSDEVGMPELAPVLAVDVSLIDEQSVVAALRAAQEVKALCAIAGMPERASVLNASRTSVANARTELCNALATLDAEVVVNTAPTSASQSAPSTPTIDTRAIYAKANAKTPLKRSN